LTLGRAAVKNGWLKNFRVEVTMLAYFFILIAVAMRFGGALGLTPFAFMPTGAALLFFGAKKPKRQIWIAVGLLMAADVALSTLWYHYPLSADLLVSWGWYVGIALLGSVMGREPKPLKLAGAALASSVSFFLLSNFAVWAVWGMYPKTLAGLASCYGAGLPFFRNDVAGTLFFSAVLFGVPALLTGLATGLRRQESF
jgi:hypothetical protein